MFWNLVRYEFKNVNKWYLALYGAVLALSGLIGIQAKTYNNLPIKEVNLFYLFSSTRVWWLDDYAWDFNLDFDHPSLQR